VYVIPGGAQRREGDLALRGPLLAFAPG
jgi:hypothetical protein